MGQVLSVLFFTIGVVEGAAFIVRLRRAYLPIWNKEHRPAKCPFSGSSEPLPVPRNRRSLVGDLVRGVADRVWSKASSEKSKAPSGHCPVRNVTPAAATGDRVRGEDAKVPDKGRKVSSDPVFPTLKEREEVEESRQETVERGPSPTLPMVKSPVPRTPPLGPESVRVTKPVLDGCFDDPGLTPPPPPSPPPPSEPELPPDLSPSETGVSEAQEKLDRSKPEDPGALPGESRDSIVEDGSIQCTDSFQTADVPLRVVKSPLTRRPPISPETLIARQSSFEAQASSGSQISKQGEVEVACDEPSDAKPAVSDVADGGVDTEADNVASITGDQETEQPVLRGVVLEEHGVGYSRVDNGETLVNVVGDGLLGEVTDGSAAAYDNTKREQQGPGPLEFNVSGLNAGQPHADGGVDEQFSEEMESLARALGGREPEQAQREGSSLAKNEASTSRVSAGESLVDLEVDNRLNHEADDSAKERDDQGQERTQRESSGLYVNETNSSEVFAGEPVADVGVDKRLSQETDSLPKVGYSEGPYAAQREGSSLSNNDTNTAGVISGEPVADVGVDKRFSHEKDSLAIAQDAQVPERAQREGSSLSERYASTSGVENGERVNKKSKGGKSSKEVSWADDVIDVERESRKSDVLLPGRGGSRSRGEGRGRSGAKAPDEGGEGDEEDAGDCEGSRPRKVVVRVAGDGIVEIPPPPPFQPPPLPAGKEDPGEVRLRFERPRASRSPSNPREEAGELPAPGPEPLVASGRHGSLVAGDSSSSSGKEAFWLIFSGEYTKAMSKEWHSGHFCCWQCDESLTGQRYVLRDDHPYCVRCYESVFANLCEQCNKTIGIDSKDLSYKDKHWHEACFLCTKCRVSLVDKQFGSKADKIYCGNCYDAQFASRCDGCGEIFRAGTKKMEYKTRQWHEKCFCCCVCKTAIGTKSFIPREQEIYCATCYEEKFATRCVKCNKIITTGGVTYKNEPWHRECFTCTHCNTSLAGQRFTSRDEKPYCAECFGELFAKRCVACSRPITGIGGTRFISFEDRHWHNDCFICASCKSSLVGRGFITDGEDIICPECAKQKLM